MSGQGASGPSGLGRTGVIGIGGFDGFGVRGTVQTGNGISVFAQGSGAGVKAVNAHGGAALSVESAAAFSRSGIVTVGVDESSATESNVALTAASLVLAILQQKVAGVSVQSVPDVPGSSFTVHLSRAVMASTKVAWFVAN